MIHSQRNLPKAQTKGGDVYLYKSATLGSNSWRKVKKIHDDKPGDAITTASCEIIQKYDDEDTILVFCRNKLLISNNGIQGNYNMRIMNKPDGGYIDSRLKFGGSSIYQHGKNLYLVTSRLRIPETKTRKRTRHLYIYKLNDEWNDFDNNFTPITWEWNTFESPMITRRKNSITYLRPVLEALRAQSDTEEDRKARIAAREALIAKSDKNNL